MNRTTRVLELRGWFFSKIPSLTAPDLDAAKYGAALRTRAEKFLHLGCARVRVSPDLSPPRGANGLGLHAKDTALQQPLYLLTISLAGLRSEGTVQKGAAKEVRGHPRDQVLQFNFSASLAEL